MKILLLGATGRTGRFVISEALKRGHQISAIARDPEKLKEFGIGVVQGSPYDYSTVEKALAGCDAVINTLNVSRKSDSPWASLTAPADLISRSAANALAAMEKTGVRRFVALGTIGAGRSWKTLPALLKFVVNASNLKYAFRDHGRQEELLETSRADYTICRAPMLTSDGGHQEALPAPEGSKPFGPKLSRQSAAVFFIDIIESNRHIRETISLSNSSGK